MNIDYWVNSMGICFEVKTVILLLFSLFIKKCELYVSYTYVWY